MSASAIFIMDLKGKILISRNYRGDVPMSASEKFTKHLMEDEESALTPIITDDGVTFVYIKHNNLYLMALTKKKCKLYGYLKFSLSSSGGF